MLKKPAVLYQRMLLLSPIIHISLFTELEKTNFQFRYLQSLTAFCEFLKKFMILSTSRRSDSILRASYESRPKKCFLTFLHVINSCSNFAAWNEVYMR